ncbi:MAG: lasso peptide biosynthesis B2 protein [Pseudomonadota bacterium]
MPDRPGLRRLLGAPPTRILLAVEAGFELTLARLNTLGSAKHFTNMMGELDGRPIDADAAQQDRAQLIGHIVEITARVMPFRAVCLQQVMATRRMMKRRHLPSTVFLGVLPNENDPATSATHHMSTQETLIAAHAWVKSGDRIINGKVHDLDRYVVLGIFS